MALSRPFPVDKAYPNPADVRRELSGFLPREGVLPDPTTVATAGIGYKGSGWAVGARPFVAVCRRAAADFALSSYGSALIANDANVATAWTLPGAPGSGSRIDLLWVRIVDPSQGDALSVPSGEPIERAVPVFGITSGVAATTPSRPALPAGALELVEATTSAGAASVASTTLRASYAFAALIGGAVVVRTSDDLPATGVPGETAVALNTGKRYVRGSGTTAAAWRAAQQWETQADGAGAADFVQPSPGVDPVLRVGYMKNVTSSGGQVTVEFDEPLPSELLHVSIQTLEGTSQAPLVLPFAYSKTGFVVYYPGVNGQTVAFTYLAIGY